MKKKIMNLTKGDIFETPDGYTLVCIDNTSKSGYVYVTTVGVFVNVELKSVCEYDDANSSWEEFNPSEMVEIKGCLI